jgi:hypothetical protein
MQAPVSNPRMVVTNSSGGSFNFQLIWERPGLSGALFDTGGLSQANLDNLAGHELAGWWEWTHFPIAYDVQFRNATLNETWNASVPPLRHDSGLSQGPAASTINVNNLSRSFAPSSLYQIQVLPVNESPRRIVTPSTTPGMAPIISIGREQTPIDTSFVPGQRDIIFLSDIQIDMSRTFGRGNSITVEWDNPTFNGMNIFDEWEIAYAPHNPANPTVGSANVRRIPISQIDVLAGGRLRYTLTDPRINPMGLYNVRVEPMRNGQRFRPGEGTGGTGPQSNTITIDGRIYNTASSPPNVEYRTESPVLMAPELHLDVIGADFVRLWWSRFEGISGDISRIVLEEWRPDVYGEADPFANISDRVLEMTTIYGTQNISNTNELLLGPNLPRIIRAFALAVYLEGSPYPVRTNLVIYDPTYVEFSPYRPEIINLGAQHTTTNGWLEPFQFQAFVRAPFVIEETALLDQDPHADFNPPGSPPRFIDQAVQYEIYVADSWETLEMMQEPLMVRTPAQLLLIPHPSPLAVAPSAFDPTWRLNERITEFYTRVPAGLERRAIEGNRVYYVKIRAVRLINDAPSELVSQWAYGSVFMPPFDGIPTTPEMIAAPPVHVSRETENSIEIRWPLRYLEAEQENATLERDIWHSMLGVTPNGRLIFGRSSTQIENAVDYRDAADGTPRYAVLNDLLSATERASLLGQGALPLDITNPVLVGLFLQGPALNAVQQFLSRMGATGDVPALRIQDMTGKNYEIHVVEYNHMMQLGTQHQQDGESPFEAYRERILQGAANQGQWHSISPSFSGGSGAFNVTQVHAPAAGGLQENTAYVIFIRTYEITTEGIKISYFPNFVIGNTISNVVRPIPDPTTPVLHPVPEFISDQSIGVRWRVQADTGFELYIAERMAEHPAGGYLLPPPLTTQAEIDAALADPNIPFDIRDVNGVPYYHLRIDNLFPGTTYYVWARAFGLNPDGEVATPPSQPSNPVDMRTLDISPPRPPSIAPAPTSLLNVYNRLNDTNFSRSEPDALNILLTRIFSDYDMGTPRADDGEADGGSVSTINLPQDLYRRMYILRFEELTPNTRYYIRARTILTVERTGGFDSPVERTYSYEIQVADNEDFLDPITFVIPATPDVDENSVNVRRAISDWVQIELDTGRDDSEYDGVHRPEQYPLPDRDWEITYDPLTQTMQWRFRTNQTGADGRPDQNVNERFISRLISERTFVYEIDMSTFGNFPITNRVVEIPVSIIRAFDDRRITLQINAGDLIYSIPPGAFDTAAVRALQQGTQDFFRINMDINPPNLPQIQTNTSYATAPQRLHVTAHNAVRNIRMDTFARPLRIILPVTDTNVGLFHAGENINGWQDMNAQFSFVNNSLSAEIQRPAIFAAIERNTPPIQTPSPSNEAMRRVTARLNFTDLTNFDAAREITANEFNNIVNAVVQNRSSVTMGANIPAANIQSLTRSRMLAPSDLTRETAIDILVRLYENRTRQVLTPMSPIASIPGAQNATQSLQRNLRIAADIGFITGPLEPRGRFTMGEMMHMLDIIYQDMGI